MVSPLYKLSFAFTYILCSHLCDSYNISDIRGLRKHLAEDYDSRIRPVANQSDILEIQVKLSVTSIAEYDTISGRMKVSGYLTVKWRDEFMQWLETDFGGVGRINVDPKEIWTPWMEQIYDADEDYMFSTIWLNSDGNTSMVLVGKFVGHCDVDLRYFPLDEQVCGFIFISPRNDAAELNFSLIKDSVEINSMMRHGEWDIFKSNAYRILYDEADIDLDVVGLKFDLNLRRRPQFVLIHTTAPLALIALLNMITFVVPILSGERISFSVSILLALIFFTSNIVDNIPHSSTRIPLLSMATAAITALCTMNVIISVIFSRVAATKFKPVSGCLKSFVRFIVRVKFGIKVRKKHINAGPARNLHKCNGNKPDDPEKDNPTIKETCCKKNCSEEDFEITWIMVADIFDWIMFYVHLLVVGTAVVLSFLFVIDII